MKVSTETVSVRSAAELVAIQVSGRIIQSNWDSAPSAFKWEPRIMKTTSWRKAQPFPLSVSWLRWKAELVPCPPGMNHPERPRLLALRETVGLVVPA